MREREGAIKHTLALCIDVFISTEQSERIQIYRYCVNVHRP